jgi:hypothetical protein
MMSNHEEQIDLSFEAIDAYVKTGKRLSRFDLPELKVADLHGDVIAIDERTDKLSRIFDAKDAVGDDLSVAAPVVTVNDHSDHYYRVVFGVTDGKKDVAEVSVHLKKNHQPAWVSVWDKQAKRSIFANTVALSADKPVLDQISKILSTQPDIQAFGAIAMNVRSVQAARATGPSVAQLAEEMENTRAAVD